jgi:hypothetical protein
VIAFLYNGWVYVLYARQQILILSTTLIWRITNKPCYVPLILKTMSCETENKINEAPVVSVDDFYHEKKTLIVHNYINIEGKMVLNKEQASLLLIELYKFVNS